MYNTLAVMRQDLMGMVPGFAPSTYTSAIQRAYDDLIKAHPWQDLETDGSVVTKQFVDTGGAHFEQGATDVTAATTVSAAWTATANKFAGMFIVKRDDAAYSTITASTSISITLTSAYLGKTTTASVSSGDGYAIFQHIYSVPSDIGEVISVMCEDDRLGKATDAYINQHDADFQEDGEPSRWRALGRDSAGNTRIQIYPALIDDVYLLRIHGRRKVETLANTTSPLLDSSLINAFAEVELMKRKRLMDPTTVTDGMIESSMANAANHFNYATEQERRNSTDEPYVQDKMFEGGHRGQDWYVSHDPWDA